MNTASHNHNVYIDVADDVAIIHTLCTARKQCTVHLYVVTQSRSRRILQPCFSLVFKSQRVAILIQLIRRVPVISEFLLTVTMKVSVLWNVTSKIQSKMLPPSSGFKDEETYTFGMHLADCTTLHPRRQ
jgi:hypothetical protein